MQALQVADERAEVTAEGGHEDGAEGWPAGGLCLPDGFV